MTQLAVAYIRASTDEQKLGPEAQRSEIEAWAEREKVHVLEWHEDSGVSGAAKIEDCPALLDALAAVERHKVGLLLVSKRDRLARDVSKALAIEQVLSKLGARVVSTDGTGNGDEPEAQLLRLFLDGFAQYERARISLRTRAAMRAKSARGGCVGPVPVGYRVKTTRTDAQGALRADMLEPDPKEQELLRECARLRGEGLSLEAVARVLAVAGHVHPRTGERIGSSTVYRWLAPGRLRESAENKRGSE